MCYFFEKFLCVGSSVGDEGRVKWTFKQFLYNYEF